MPTGIYPRLSAAERFWAKVQKTDTCWLWLGNLDSGGYGMFRVGGRMTMVHRFAYELLVGPIPDGLTLDHLCGVTVCVWPFHLEPTTMRENILRGESFSAHNARKTRCLRGHPLRGENLYIYPDGRRGCYQCQREHDSQRRLRQRRVA